MAPLCVCYSCGRHMDCDPSGVCEVCEGSVGEKTQDIPVVTNIKDISAIRLMSMVKPVVKPAVKPRSVKPVLLDAIVPDDRQILNILQQLHQNILRENEPYVRYSQSCRWQFTNHTYACEHVSISEHDVLATYNHQMEK